METHDIMLNSQVVLLSCDKARAEVKTQMVLKEAALRAEFRKKELEERRSRSGTASTTSSRRSGDSKAVGMKTGCERIDVPTEIA